MLPLNGGGCAVDVLALVKLDQADNTHRSSPCALRRAQDLVSDGQHNIMGIIEDQRRCRGSPGRRGMAELVHPEKSGPKSAEMNFSQVVSGMGPTEY
jgi:hypothetical protein